MKSKHFIILIILLSNFYIAIADIPQNDVTSQKIRILLVAGHEPNFGGSEFSSMKERDMNVELEKELENYLKDNPRYEVFTTRDKDSWSPWFQKYFTENDSDIVNFISSKKQIMNSMITNGQMKIITDGVEHNDAPPDVAKRLYAINKWANENNIDITLHIHFNDDTTHGYTRSGKFSGFVIYVPDGQYSNAKSSKEIANHLEKNFSLLFPTSNAPKESGVTPDQDLIAIGYANTSNKASMLIEYGYIYEMKFSNEQTRKAIIKELACQTYAGLEDFFGSDNHPCGTYKTTLLPYTWNKNLVRSTKPNIDVLSLQAALLQQGYFPPNNMTKNDCPLSGVFGKCTRLALADFQRVFNIKGNGTFAGLKTKETLNKTYGQD